MGAMQNFLMPPFILFFYKSVPPDRENIVLGTTNAT